MAIIANPPCDEDAILASACARPTGANGPWILAATILGSGMAFIDGTVVNVALPALLYRWIFVRPVWPSQNLRRGCGDLIHSVGLVRTRAQHPRAYSCEGSSGIGGALLVPGSLALISANFPENERGRRRSLGYLRGPDVGTTFAVEAVTAGGAPHPLLGFTSAANSWLGKCCSS